MTTMHTMPKYNRNENQVRKHFILFSLSSAMNTPNTQKHINQLQN